MRHVMRETLLWAANVCALLVSCSTIADERPLHGRDSGATRASPVAQLTLDNVGQLQTAGARAGDWPNYGNDPGGMRFSPLTQINRKNVSKLKTAWVYHTGDISDGHGRPRSGFETTPLFVDDTLFLTTPFNRVIAIDPATGQQRWVFDPKIDQGWQSGDGLINRGLATWGTA